MRYVQTARLIPAGLGKEHDLLHPAESVVASPRVGRELLIRARRQTRSVVESPLVDHAQCRLMDGDPMVGLVARVALERDVMGAGELDREVSGALGQDHARPSRDRWNAGSAGYLRPLLLSVASAPGNSWA